MSFDDFTFDDAAKVIKDLKDEGAESSRKFRRGDHWQDSNAWVGPWPKSTDTLAATTREEIKRGFISQNVIGEVSQRRNSAVIGREPSWGITPTRKLASGEKPNEKEQPIIDLVDAFASDWWDAREALKMLRESAADLSDGRGLVRLFVPPGLLVNNQIPTVPIERAIDYIFLSIPEPDQATIITDPDTQRRASLFAYEHVVGEKKFTRYEMSYVGEIGEEKGKTVVRILTETGDKVEPDRMALDLGGHLLMYEMKDEPLITAQVRQHQALLNMARTMMGRNVVLGGFLERVFLNVEMPGEVDKDGKFTPNPIYVGAGTANVLSGSVVRDKQGEPIVDEAGRPTIANPSVVFRDPVSVATFEETAQAAYLSILKETHQLHAAISGDATASGESRKQAMDDFRKSLQPVKAQIDACGRWLIETMLAMAAQFSGKAGMFNEFRAVFDCQIDVGKPTDAEITTGVTLVEKKIWKRSRLQALTNVEDTEAEDTEILADEKKLKPVATEQPPKPPDEPGMQQVETTQ